jgi:hypothetical protein
MMTVFRKRVPDALGRHRRILGDGEVDQAARVGIERPHLLRPGVLRLLHREARHLLQLVVLAAAIAHAVDDEAAVVVQLAAEAGVDDLLERVEGLALALQQHSRRRRR